MDPASSSGGGSSSATVLVVVGLVGVLSTLYVDTSGSVVLGNAGATVAAVEVLDVRRDASSVVLFGDTSKGSRRCPRGKAFDIESKADGYSERGLRGLEGELDGLI